MNSGTCSHLPLTAKDRPTVNSDVRANAKENMQDTKTRAAPGLLGPARDNIYHCGSHVIFQDAYSKCFESIAIRFFKK